MEPMTAAPHTLTITRPDDWHLHVRDGEPLHTVVPHTAAQFGRAIIMPNLRPPVTTAEQARESGAFQFKGPAGTRCKRNNVEPHCAQACIAVRASGSTAPHSAQHSCPRPSRGAAGRRPGKGGNC